MQELAISGVGVDDHSSRHFTAMHISTPCTVHSADQQVTVHYVCTLHINTQCTVCALYTSTHSVLCVHCATPFSSSSRAICAALHPAGHFSSKDLSMGRNIRGRNILGRNIKGENITGRNITGRNIMGINITGYTQNVFCATRSSPSAMFCTFCWNQFPQKFQQIRSLQKLQNYRIFLKWVTFTTTGFGHHHHRGIGQYTLGAETCN